MRCGLGPRCDGFMESTLLLCKQIVARYRRILKAATPLATRPGYEKSGKIGITCSTRCATAILESGPSRKTNFGTSFRACVPDAYSYAAVKGCSGSEKDVVKEVVS